MITSQNSHRVYVPVKSTFGEIWSDYLPMKRVNTLKFEESMHSGCKPYRMIIQNDEAYFSHCCRVTKETFGTYALLPRYRCVKIPTKSKRHALLIMAETQTIVPSMYGTTSNRDLIFVFLPNVTYYFLVIDLSNNDPMDSTLAIKLMNAGRTSRPPNPSRKMLRRKVISCHCIDCDNKAHIAEFQRCAYINTSQFWSLQGININPPSPHPQEEQQQENQQAQVLVRTSMTSYQSTPMEIDEEDKEDDQGREKCIDFSALYDLDDLNDPFAHRHTFVDL
jgi:hypothetical protein